MSGTSLDGVDAVLVDFSGIRPVVLGHCSAPLPAPLKNELMALNCSGEDELHRAALAANALVRVYAEQIHRLLVQCGKVTGEVRAIGAHGQTVRHRPQEFDGTGYTIQLNNAALLAELCAIDVVADFRSRDVAAGGQGAPLVPPFHRAFFGRSNEVTAVLNVGGISNLTVLDPKALDLIGFDCGPGNALMDAWCLAHIGQPFDDAGVWAGRGEVNRTLLTHLFDEPFFAKKPPKSTGRDLFNPGWLRAKLQAYGDLPAVHVQATLAELTAQSCAQSLMKTAPNCRTLSVCGGGAFNRHLMQRLQSALPFCQVQTSEAEGLPPVQVEATAFAWLARQTTLGKTSSLQSVTGTKGARILGGIYRA
jgi:anhydro-N-acetylmuramic acid kinase